jgi:Gpi18-like mannosyltransferase
MERGLSLPSPSHPHHGPEIPAALAPATRNRGTIAEATASGWKGWIANRGFLWIYLGLTGSLLLRLSVLDYRSGDYEAFLSHWYDYFVQHGRWAGLADRFTGYPVFYLELLSISTLLPLPKLYAVKLMSIAGDYVTAWYAFRIVRGRPAPPNLAWAAALGMLYLPTVWLNSAAWGQCDGMVAAALLGSLYYFMRARPLAGMVALGLAGALKPQGILLAPFVAGLFFRERRSWKLLVLPPFVYGLCGLPAILAGRPTLDVLLRWARHTNYPKLTMGATNWYEWVSNDYYQVFFMAGIVLGIVAAVALVLAMQEDVQVERAAWLVTAALLSVMVVPYFLPGMHERYFYAADVLSIVYAFFVRRGWLVAALVEFCSFFTYVPYLFKEEPVSRPLLALVMTLTLGIVAADFARGITLLQGGEVGADAQVRGGGK